MISLPMLASQFPLLSGGEFPNSWLNGFNSPVNMAGTIHFNQVIG
jgi:hypothetical protein